MNHPFLLLALLVLLLPALCSAFYLPGVAPEDFADGDPLPIKVNSLTSAKTNLPFSYYSLPFCEPETVESKGENLGEVLRGDVIQSTPLKVAMGKEETCKVLCRSTLDKKGAEAFAEKIREEYAVNMILDNLPIGERKVRQVGNPPAPEIVYTKGFPLGVVGGAASLLPHSKDGETYINNHLSFTILYHKDSSFEGSRVVAFEVEAASVKHEFDGAKLKTCNVNAGMEPQPAAAGEVVFTYDVAFKASPVKWASRWDMYLHMGDEQIHWFSIMNAILIVLFLTGMLAMIMMRNLSNDFRRYNEVIDDAEDAQEETGWKLVHGDVFRPPPHPQALAAAVGTGTQLCGMVAVVMASAALGFLSPSSRGGLMTAMIFFFAFMGVWGGHRAARIFKMFKGVAWKTVSLKVALAFPLLVFGVFFVLNFFIWGERSSGAVPFGTMFVLLLLWFGISIPMVFIGSFLGFRKDAIELPCRTNQIPRQVPEQRWFQHSVFSALVAGVLPFGAIFIELFFILNSVWRHEFYYLFGFLFLVFVIAMITCAEITVVLCYFQLCAEDYHWWWRSFFIGGSAALYIFLYSVFYYVTKIEYVRMVSGLMYFSYIFIVCVGIFFALGSAGFGACLWFVRKIYGAVKID